MKASTRLLSHVIGSAERTFFRSALGFDLDDNRDEFEMDNEFQVALDEAQKQDKEILARTKQVRKEQATQNAELELELEATVGAEEAAEAAAEEAAEEAAEAADDSETGKSLAETYFPMITKEGR